MASSSGLGGARAFSEHMCLGPERMTYRADTYLRVVGVHCDSPVFAVPVEILAVGDRGNQVVGGAPYRWSTRRPRK